MENVEKFIQKEVPKKVSEKELLENKEKLPRLKKTREEIATIARFDFNKDEDKWKLTDRFKDPRLAKIEK